MLMYLNVGAKYPAMSETQASGNSIEESMVAKAEYDKYVQMYEEIYKQSVIQQIEFESEILIPDCIDFKYVEYTYKLSQELKISPRVAFRLIFKESSFNEAVQSPVGATGLTQLMPDTRKIYYDELRVDTMKLDKTQEDIYIGLCYLNGLQEFWRERGNSEKNLLRLAVAAYNAGYANVIKYSGVPPYKETQDFVAFILKPHSNPSFYATIIKKNEKKQTS
jgi:soluble lytic murein transglycosylase-like protein